MNENEFKLFAKRNLKRYVINKLCGVYRLLKDEPPTVKYYINLFSVLFNFYFLKRVFIPQIEFLVTNNCTLNCKYCSNYIPYIDEKFNLPFEDFKLYLDNLLFNVYKLNSLILLGGEALLNPDFYKIVEYSLQQKQVDKVYIFTNGTMLFDKKLLELLKKYRKKTHVYLSNYTSNESIKNKLKTDELLEQLQENKIKFTFKKKTIWVKQEPIECHNRREDENAKINSKCPVPSVSSALGEVHICPKASAARMMNVLHFKKDDFIDLKKIVTKDELISFYKNDKFSICGYCLGPESTKYLIKPAEQND